MFRFYPIFLLSVLCRTATWSFCIVSLHRNRTFIQSSDVKNRTLNPSRLQRPVCQHRSHRSRSRDLIFLRRYVLMRRKCLQVLLNLSEQGLLCKISLLFFRLMSKQALLSISIKAGLKTYENNYPNPIQLKRPMASKS